MTKNGTEDGNSPEYVRMQADFLSALGTTTDFLREAGVPGGDMMVISGGATFLYELDQTGASDRGPTDLDVIFRPTLEAPERFYGLFAELEENDRFVNSYLHTKPRTHHGFTFTTPLIETKVAKTGFPVDLICRDMVTVFPDDHPLLPDMSYRFPTDDRRVYELARTLHVWHWRS